MDLTFNIIFIPGTVRYLRLAVLSLLQYSSYRFRLVANGLDPSELTLLRDFCDTSERLLFFPFPVKTPVPHGVLLTILQQRENGAHFCFMDSDIFAAAPFQAELEAHLRECDVFSSCESLYLDDSESTVGYDGCCFQSPAGLPLATTYFAVYRNEPLRRVITASQIGFEPYYSVEQYPRSIRKRLDQVGASDAVYCDTGKLLNLLSHAYGLRYRHAAIDSLLHIGGVSGAFAKSGWLKERLPRFLNRPYVLCDQDLEPRPSLFRKWLGKSGRPADDSSERYKVRRHRDRLRRRRIAAFFGFFLQAIVDGTPEPVLALNDGELADRIGNLCTTIRSMRNAHLSCRSIGNEQRSALAA